MRFTQYVSTYLYNLSSEQLNNKKELKLPYAIGIIIHPGEPWTDFVNFVSATPRSNEINKYYFNLFVKLIYLSQIKVYMLDGSLEIQIFLICSKTASVKSLHKNINYLVLRLDKASQI
jgi:hypothetical protein